MQSIQADLDDSGQLAAISTIPQAIGSAIGPAAFAMALTVGRYPMGFGLVTVLMLVSLVMVIPPALEVERLRGGIARNM